MAHVAQRRRVAELGASRGKPMLPARAKGVPITGTPQPAVIVMYEVRLTDLVALPLAMRLAYDTCCPHQPQPTGNLARLVRATRSDSSQGHPRPILQRADGSLRLGTKQGSRLAHATFLRPMIK
ncbi:hypothetical protein Micbo1qcDRAFT_175360 [Microdochium bolleyi]|uniref:Uncharacterized protein n=1 Tax=Microdochium bolleyi TaxID=196109 RepID=A0A136J5Y9_9PEZI|nr:hypothetical protein Micbo1qcDRAFT_175360 [Microdochium bolleyi]